MLYPIGIQDFADLRRKGFVYVDKTRFVYELAATGKYYFLSRPRRFGKSLLLSTMEYYFLGKKDLFKGLALEELEKEWTVYPVLYLDLNTGEYDSVDALAAQLNRHLRVWEALYGDEYKDSLPDERFLQVIKLACERTKQQVVILIDEYDKPLLQNFDNPALQDKLRSKLKAFYSVLKTQDRYIRFAFLTGVTKFGKVSVFSDLNNLNDIRMVMKYDTLCGITEKELHQYFTSAIEKMAEEEECTAEEMFSQFKQMYDGYHFSRRMRGVYNPFSVLNALNNMDLVEYWFKTGTPTYLVQLMENFSENMDEMTSKYYAPAEFEDYRADKERPVPMIYQSGCLTIKDYDKQKRRYRLGFPNKEVEEGFLPLIAASYLQPSGSIQAWINDVRDALADGNLKMFRKLMTSLLSGIPYTARRKNDERERERYFSYTFYLILKMISGYAVYIEKESSCGRTDCVIETPRFIYVIEFKPDKTAKEAVEQINAKGYALEYAGDKRKLYKIGVAFSSKTETVSDFEAE